MTDRHTADSINDDDLDALYDQLDAAASRATPASTAPLAAGLPLVRGHCPACGRQSLFLGSGGHVTCSTIDCRNPSAADEVLRHAHLTECQHASGQRQAEATLARVCALRDDLRGITGARYIADMLDKILDPSGPAEVEATTPTPCPACARADQAGLAPDEQHPACRDREQP